MNITVTNNSICESIVPAIDGPCYEVFCVISNPCLIHIISHS